mmetsp:Transcript_11998/g.19532  ORF Transcript_11998/g.19532 Transcript_11998/m.19532 type:complete len:258 (+) Transcript_11998:228-1001(+)
MSNQTPSSDHNYSTGDVESHAVNVTPIPVAHQQQQQQDNDLDVIMLDIIPGVYQVQSAFHNDDVNVYSRKVIRFALALCIFNILIAILTTAGGSTDALIDALVFITMNAIIFYVAVRSVRSQQVACCCGLSALSFYRYFLMVNIFFVSIYLIIYIAVVASGHLWAIPLVVYYLVHLILYCNQLRYVNKIVKAVSSNVHPGNSTSGVRSSPVRQLSVQPAVANAVPTTAVVQSSPSIARVEIDSSQGGQTRDPYGYGG